MSIQPLSNSPPSAEPAVQRRRAAERETGGESESFVLPREEPAREAAAPVRESARETRREAGEARRAADEPASTETPSETAAKPTASEADSKTPAAETVKTTGKTGAKTAGKAAEPASAAPPASPNLDIGALVSIAVAAQAAGLSEVAGKTGAAGETKTGEGKETAVAGDKAEGDAAKGPIAAEAKAEGVPVLLAALPVPVAAVPPGPAPTLPPASGATAAAAEGDLLSGKASATAAAALALASAREAVTGPDSETAPSPAATAATSLVARHGAANAAAEAMPLPAAADAAPTQGAGQGGSDPLAPTQVQAQASGPAAPAPTDVKPIEALQQALNPIDLSALGQQGGARPEPFRILTTPEQVAAQQLPVAQGQGAADGPPTPLHVLPIEIGLRALAGARQFDIRLDPGELGRVDVNLSISDKGEVSAKMVVDRVETLHLLQRDARTLERAFEQAGLKPSDAGVEITLRDPSDQSGFRQNRQQDEAPQGARRFGSEAEAGEDNPISTQPAPVRRFVRLGGVDLSV